MSFIMIMHADFFCTFAFLTSILFNTIWNGIGMSILNDDARYSEWMGFLLSVCAVSSFQLAWNIGLNFGGNEKKWQFYQCVFVSSAVQKMPCMYWLHPVWINANRMNRFRNRVQKKDPYWIRILGLFGIRTEQKD